MRRVLAPLWGSFSPSCCPPGPKSPGPRIMWLASISLSSRGSRTSRSGRTPPSHTLVLTPSLPYLGQRVARTPAPGVTPTLSTQLSGRMTPFFWLITVHSDPRPLPPGCPCRQSPGPRLDPLRCPQTSPTLLALRHQASAALLESVSGCCGAGRPPDPEAQGP